MNLIRSCKVRLGLAVLAAAALGAVAGSPAADPGGQIHQGILASPVVTRFGLSFAPRTGGPGDLDRLTEQAVAANPSILAAAAEAAAAGDRVSQMRALPEPRIGLTEYLEPVETRVGPQRRALSLTQSFPWFGTLGLMAAVQQEQAQAAGAVLDQTILDVIAQLKTAVFELAFLDQSIAVTSSHLELLSTWEEAAQGRYAAGRGKYSDLIKAQVELGKLANRLAELQERRAPLTATVNAALDRAPEAPLVLAPLPQPAVLDLQEQDLAALLVRNNPRLQAWRYRSEAARRGADLAGRQGLPSFTVGLNLIQTGPARMDGVMDSGKDALMATVGITVPLWRGKYGAAESEAAGRLLAADASGRQTLNTLRTALTLALFKYRDAARQLDLYGATLLPKGRQALDAVQAAFSAGEGGFLDLIDAQRLLLEFELARMRAGIDLSIQQAEIENLIAAPLVTRSTAAQP